MDTNIEQIVREAEEARWAAGKAQLTEAVGTLPEPEVERHYDYTWVTGKGPIVVDEFGDSWRLSRVTVREADDVLLDVESGERGPWHDVTVQAQKLRKDGRLAERSGYFSTPSGGREALWEMHRAAQAAQGEPLPATAYPSHGSDLPPAPKTSPERQLLIAHLLKASTPASGHGHGSVTVHADLDGWSNEALDTYHRKAHYQEGA